MRQKSILIIFFIFCLSILFNVTIQSNNEKTIVVQAVNGWQNSGVYLRPGDTFMVRARGKWVSGYGHDWYGPEGWGYGTLANDVLVGWISESRPTKLGYNSYTKGIIQNIILIGKGGTFKSGKNGYLYLAMGEWSGCHECRGNVTVKIIKKIVI